MSVSDDFVAHVRDLLEQIGHIPVKRMFSGAGLFHDGLMFALIVDDVLYLKADSEAEVRFEEEGCQPFAYRGKTRQVKLGYWRAPERLYDDPELMADWARSAIAVARRAHAAAPAKKKSSRKAAPVKKRQTSQPTRTR